jgi:ribosome-associated heat shock protein Hsp15
MAIRIDKYIWCVRLCKTRSQATELISKGKIKLNGMQIKASREAKINDIISIQRNAAIFEYKILNTIDKRLGAKLVPEYLIDVTKPEEIEKHKNYQLVFTRNSDFLRFLVCYFHKTNQMRANSHFKNPLHFLGIPQIYRKLENGVR